ncbi:MAG TPA: hypothetical protein ENJ09_01160 [Planctomycetes bacterium]|nr:hypothetical protein [Planctomycetota bacterium]
MPSALEAPPSTRPVLLLGPQRWNPVVGPAVRELLGGGELHAAVITAGWEEREHEDEELREHLAESGISMENLRLFERAEDAFREDPALLEKLIAHGSRLEERQSLYRLRLAHLLDAARALLARERPRDLPLLREEIRNEAIEDIRRLDEEHLRALLVEEEAAESAIRPFEHAAIRRHRDELDRILARSRVLLIAGGHVLVLLRRLRLFGFASELGPTGTLPLVAWSAGAMATGERVVLFHDSPPQGPGNAEVLHAGFGAYRGLLPLPHASHRLRLEDPVRVGLFARRFGPEVACAFDEGARVRFDGGRANFAPGSRLLRADGNIEETRP